MRATREYFTNRGYVKMPADGPLTPAVPGEVLAWQTIVRPVRDALARVAH